MVGGKNGGPTGGAHAASLLLIGHNTMSRQLESSTDHVIGVSHYFIKMYQFITSYFT